MSGSPIVTSNLPVSLPTLEQNQTFLSNGFVDSEWETIRFWKSWVQPEAYFSFAYSAICDWLWERNEWSVDGKTKAQLVGVAVETAEQIYGFTQSKLLLAVTVFKAL